MHEAKTHQFTKRKLFPRPSNLVEKERLISTCNNNSILNTFCVIQILPTAVLATAQDWKVRFIASWRDSVINRLLSISVTIIAKRIGILYKSKTIFSPCKHWELYILLINLPISKWWKLLICRNTYHSRLESVRKLQKKIIRIIPFSDFTDHTRPFLQKRQLLH